MVTHWHTMLPTETKMGWTHSKMVTHLIQWSKSLALPLFFYRCTFPPCSHWSFAAIDSTRSCFLPLSTLHMVALYCWGDFGLVPVLELVPRFHPAKPWILQTPSWTGSWRYRFSPERGKSSSIHLRAATSLGNDWGHCQAPARWLIADLEREKRNTRGCEK